MLTQTHTQSASALAPSSDLPVLDKVEVLYSFPDQKQLTQWNAAGWRVVSICANLDTIFCYLTCYLE